MTSRRTRGARDTHSRPAPPLPTTPGDVPGVRTRVFLRQYFESEHNARTTTDADGNFALSTRIRAYDHDFVLFSAPEDYCVAGASKTLPVRNTGR